MNIANMGINQEQDRQIIPPVNINQAEALFRLENLTKVFRSDNVETTAPE